MLTYWSFPSQGISALLPANAERSDLTIRQYLNISAAYPSATDFSVTAPYAGDVIKLAWPTDEYVSLQRSWHCMPCKNVKPDHKIYETFDWDSCSYDESPPSLYSMGFNLAKKIKSNPSIHESIFTLTWPYRMEPGPMLCTFTIPGTFPHGLSAAFPFINAPPPPGRGQHIFASDAPGGVPREAYAMHRGGRGGTVASALLVVIFFAILVVGTIAGRRYWMAKAAQTLKRYLEKEKKAEEGRQVKYTDES